MGRQNSDDKESEAALYFRMKENLKQDNRHIFVRLINRLSSDDKELAVLDICHYDAANCLAAVLDGVGGQSLITCCVKRTKHKIIRVLARNTKEIKHEFFKYLKQGKVFEVGALLAIASDLIMSSSSTNDGKNGSIGFKNIMEMRQFLLSEMSRSLIGASNTQLKEIKKTLRLLEIFDRVGDKLLAHMPMWDNYTSDSGVRVASLIKRAAYDEKEEDEDDSASVPSSYYTRLPNNYTPLPDNYTTSPYNLGHRRDYCTRKFSTQVHSPSWSEEGSCHVDVPLPMATTVKGAVTKQHVLSKKHASFTRAFAKAVRHL